MKQSKSNGITRNLFTEDGYYGWSSSTSFCIKSYPGIPTQILPINGYTYNWTDPGTQNITFEWNGTESINWGWPCNSGYTVGTKEYVIKVEGYTFTATSSSTSTKGKLHAVDVGTHTYTWNIYARHGGVYNPSVPSTTFKICVMGPPGDLTLVSPTANINDTPTGSVTFSWKLSSFGHICNYDRNKLSYKLYLQEAGQALQTHTCLSHTSITLKH